MRCFAPEGLGLLGQSWMGREREVLVEEPVVLPLDHLKILRTRGRIVGTQAATMTTFFSMLDEATRLGLGLGCRG